MVELLYDDLNNYMIRFNILYYIYIYYLFVSYNIYRQEFILFQY